MSDGEHEKRVALLRQEAKDASDDDNPRVAYFASWLAFYIEQHQHAMAAWQQSIDRMGKP